MNFFISPIISIIRDYLEQLKVNKMGNPEERDFSEKHNLSRLNQEKIENMTRPTPNTEIESVIKKLPTTKIQDQMVSQNFTKHLEKI